MQKKKKSSSVKSNKSATEEAPQLNAGGEVSEPSGDAATPAEPPLLEAPPPDSDPAAAQEQPQVTQITVRTQLIICY